MTLVKCSNCGAERELNYDQIRTVHLEKRTCPTCGIGTERVVVRETRFQPLAEHVRLAESAGVNVGLIPDTPASEPEEPEVDESAGIAVGPGGTVIRRRKPARK